MPKNTSFEPQNVTIVQLFDLGAGSRKKGKDRTVKRERKACRVGENASLHQEGFGAFGAWMTSSLIGLPYPKSVQWLITFITNIFAALYAYLQLNVC